MPDNEWLVQLIDGSLVDARFAVATLRDLHRVFQTKPGMVVQLVDFIQGKLRDLPLRVKEEYFIDGRLDSDVRAILRNAARRTEKGIVLDQPFDEDHAQTQHVLRTLEANDEIGLKRLLHELRSSRDDDLHN